METFIPRLAIAVIPFIVLVASVIASASLTRWHANQRPARHRSRRPFLRAQSIGSTTFLMVALLSAGALSGCAVTRSENRPTLNALDRAVQGSAVTRSATGKALAAPVAFTAGVTAGVVDMAVVTPARAAVPAARDTSSYLWENPQGSELRQMMLLIPKAVATPIVFTTDWAFRSVFTTRF